MTSSSSEAGFSLIEVLVALALFSAISIGIYQSMLSGVRGSQTTQNVVQIAQEARLGFNRLVRDARESNTLSCTPACPTSTAYTLNLDFDGDGTYESPNESGGHEIVTYTYRPETGTITIAAGGAEEPLIKGVAPVPGTDVFSYSSNRLEYDGIGGTPDGVTTWQEIDAAAGVGNANGVLDGREIPYISTVSVAFSISSGNRSTRFRSSAQLRNRR